MDNLLAAVAQTHGFSDDEDDDVSALPKLGLGGSSDIQLGSDASQLVGVSPELGCCSGPSAAVNQLPNLEVPVVSSGRPVVGAGDKRKRGRPPKGQLLEKSPPVKRKKEEEEEEDVCFICFDGGSLVLCDRKGCPKAYHPACIKRDDAFFRSKAKWNCGWHICSICQKASHYLCYTCTYSFCKGCTKDTDYFCVRGNKGFCSMCMKTIMLIENKELSNNNSVQVDFDDKTSWEYLFKVYWICLKEKLSLTQSELMQAKKPWNRVAAESSKPKRNSMHHNAHDEKVSISNSSSVHFEFSEPWKETSLVQNHQPSTDTSISCNPTVKQESGNSGNDLSIFMPCMDKNSSKEATVGITEKQNINKVTDEPGIGKVNETTGIKKGRNEQMIVRDEVKPYICEDIDEPADKGNYEPLLQKYTEWASKELLEFIGHMKNGDTSALSQFDVQTLLLEYVKRNNLRDPHQKSQIVCDHRLKNLFGKPRVGHIEMLKLLDSHFLMKEDSQNDYFIPAGFIGPAAVDKEIDDNTCGSPRVNNCKKRKTRKKREEIAPKNNLNDYAAIDVHNMNLIYLRRNLLERLIEDKDNFHGKVVGSFVRIRIPTNDHKQDVYRLVQVIGTIKVAEPYKIGERLADIMLEVLNLNKKEVVSLDAVSNAPLTEDECRRLCQSIRCGVVRQLTVGEVQKKAMELQPVMFDDRLEAETLRLNHPQDRANDKGHNKKFREHVLNLQPLKLPQVHRQQSSKIPIVHGDPNMCSAYESEDIRSNENIEIATEEGSVQGLGKMILKIGASGKHSSEKCKYRVDIANSGNGGWSDQSMLRSGLETSSARDLVGISEPASNIETEKLWHYRDPNGKIQGPFAMLQLRKWSTTGLFPHDMRIWTNHEQYDSVLLVDALSKKFHESSEELPYIVSTGTSSSINESDRDTKQTDATLCDNSNVLSGNNSLSVKAGDSVSSPIGCDTLKDINSFTDNVQEQSLVPTSSCHQTCIDLPDQGGHPQTENRMASEQKLQNLYDDQEQIGNSTAENLRHVPVDLAIIETVSASVPPSALPIQHNEALHTTNPPCLVAMTSDKHWEIQTAEKQLSPPPDVHVQSSGILELLSPTPRSENVDEGVFAPETKQYGLINFIVPNSDTSWNKSIAPSVGALQLPEVAEQWCGYSLTPSKPSVQEWNPGIVSPSLLKPPELTSNNDAPSSNCTPLALDSQFPSWLAMLNEPIEFDAFGEESVSDLLAEVDAMESQGQLPSPTSSMKFAKEFIQDCRDECFSSIEFSRITDTGRSDALSSTGDVHLTCQSSVPPKHAGESLIDGLDSFRKSSVHSSASSEGETNAPVYSVEGVSEFHPHVVNNTSQDMTGATMVLGTGGQEANDPCWGGTVQGNINLVTVQGNVNLVLGGPTQGMTNLGWGTNPGSAWGSSSANLSPINVNAPWDTQRKYSGERFNSPREWSYQGGDAGFGRGRPPWGRQPYNGGGGGGYSRPPPKGQRVCKFYESGHCKKGAFCDYLHP